MFDLRQNVSKGGRNPPNMSAARPPAPQGSAPDPKCQPQTPPRGGSLNPVLEAGPQSIEESLTMYDETLEDYYRQGYAVGYGDGAKEAHRFYLVVGVVLVAVMCLLLVN